MPRIIACFSHLEFEGHDLRPDPQWNGKQGHGVVAEATIDDVVRKLDCDKGCRWATPPVVLQALGSVGNPTSRPLRREAPAKQTNIRKEKTMPKAKEATSPPKRSHMKAIGTRMFGNITIAFYLVKGDIMDMALLTGPDREKLIDLLTGIKAESPHE